MRHILQFFHDIIPIVFVVGIIGVAFIFYNHTKNQAATGLAKTYTYDAELENSDITVYDGMTVSGSDVIQFAKHFYKSSSTSEYFPITVSNINAGAALTSSDISSGISSKSIYTCSVTSSSGVVTAVVFTKK